MRGSSESVSIEREIVLTVSCQGRCWSQAARSFSRSALEKAFTTSALVHVTGDIVMK